MHYINSKSVKELALHTVAEKRPAWGANRISKDFLARINAKVRCLVVQEVMAHPSKGQTLK